MHPEREFYLRELSNRFQVSPRQISLELSNLRDIELIKKRVSGNHHYYSVNQQHPLFADLRNIFLKTIGLTEVLRKYLRPFAEEIDYAFVYGSMAKGNATVKSDIDLMVIGGVTSRNLSGAILEAGQELEREINFSVFSLHEMESRLRNSDHFFTTLFYEPKLFVIGNSSEFERMGKKWLAESPQDQQ
ncbi:MAG: nucleotidyltransferase domain-containing protein [Calditrichia bacterium]